MNRSALKPPLVSLEDFEELLADAPDDARWELIGGRVVRMMVGARWEHNQIVTNLNVALVNRFRADRRPCRTLVETFRLRKAEALSSLLPDLIVYCHPLARGATSLDDPSIVFEVLSDGTQRRDREDKWAVYQTLPSLRNYVLVSRDTAHVETIDRGETEWSGHRIADGLEARLTLPSFGIDMPLSEVYADVLV